MVYDLVLTGRSLDIPKLCQFQGQCYEVLDTKSLWTEFEDWVCNESGELFLSPSAAVCLGADKRFERIAERLSALVEAGLHYGLEQGFVTAQ